LHDGIRKASQRTELPRRMPPFIYSCPNTGLRVQGWAPDDASEKAGDVFTGVTCLACGLMHFVNPKTGKRVGESDK
jgi:hypothetical protein